MLILLYNDSNIKRDSYMYNECPNCNYEHVKNNFCCRCKSSIFNIPTNIDERAKNSEYLSLVKNIKKMTNLKKQLIENLINLNYLDIIPYVKIVPEFADLNSTAFVIPDHIHDHHYEKTAPFVFANLNLYHTNYSLENVILSSSESRLMLKNNNSKNKEYIESPPPFLKWNKINIYLQYLENESIPYDISLLNSDEFEDLMENLSDQINDFSIIYWTDHDEINNSFFEKTITINLDEDLNIIYDKIKKEIELFQKFVDTTMENFKENNKKFFERALLESEISSF